MIQSSNPTKVLLTTLTLMLSLFGCSNTTDIPASGVNDEQSLSADKLKSQPEDGLPNNDSLGDDPLSNDALSNEKFEATSNKTIEVDWSLIDTKIKPIPKDRFDYPFEIDSHPVVNYANYFKLSPQQARHNLTVNMASNEAVVKVLDQLGDSYLSHKITDDTNCSLIISTTPNVKPSEFEYVIENDFAKGLILPIKIRPINLG